ncbi:GNAT family N-acetyltransferase [Yokenella regensburgei]|uniref:GNAT family N-acetyltransferase n=1 Tax=Yokenella regensburgei TaxID=158877 RepID=UPI003EDAB594
MIETPRLILRQWQGSDLEPFAGLNADPEVMKYFPATLNREESDQLAHRFKTIVAQNQGWGFWAVEHKESGDFIGGVGLLSQPDRFAFSPCTEIGWRLQKRYWHQGLAREAAEAALNYAFTTLKLAEVVSFTSIHNAASETLMQRLGFQRQGTFLHPALPEQHPLALHVLYKKRVQQSVHS